jgi:hypothetical protein
MDRTRIDFIIKGIIKAIPWPHDPEGLKRPGWKRFFWALGMVFPFFPPQRPVFLLGCGRSGTSMLGRIFGHHQRLLYLHEPRFIWSKAFPFTDIWSYRAQRRNGRLDLLASHSNPAGRKALHRMFGLALFLYGGHRILEKQPEHAFRIPFIEACFPDAKFIHLVRNGLDVARSIEIQERQGQWYGARGYKWDEIVRLARGTPWGEEALNRCCSLFHRGLIEWRLSLEFAFQGLEAIPEERVLNVKYEALVGDPAGECRRIQSFIGEGEDNRVISHALEKISRRSHAMSWSQADGHALKIAGDWPAKLGYK